MQLEQALRLIDSPKWQTGSPQTWADLGCGSGLFTHALAGRLASGSKIIAVDRDLSAFKSIPSGIEIMARRADFSAPDFTLEPLHGLLMANALHFVPNKIFLLTHLTSFLRERGIFLFVEYDSDVANPYVPYPVSWKSLQRLIAQTGAFDLDYLRDMPSRFGRARIYSALAQKRS